jgi:hypothetical protein
MLFQLDLVDVIYSLRFINVIFLVAGSIGLVIVGVSQLRNEGIMNMPFILIIDGIIIILYFSLNERLSMVLLGISGHYTILYFMIQDALYYLIPNIILLFTFGVSFIILGIRNKQNFGKFLMYSGIFWIVFGTMAIIADSIELLSWLPGLGPSFLIILIPLLTLIIASIFAITAGVFFIIYASKRDLKILLTSSILLLLYSISFSAYYIIALINYLT